MLILWMELQKIWSTFNYINDHQRKDKLLKLIVWTVKKKTMKMSNLAKKIFSSLLYLH